MELSKAVAGTALLVLTALIAPRLTTRRIEQAEHLLVSYPCVYDTRQRRLTAVDGAGRQQYRYVQVVQLLLWTLELVRTVWHMPRYRRTLWRREALPAPQVGLFE
jgi:hypothetical protein